MRILLVNPNTSEAITAAVTEAARAIAAPGTVIVPVTAAFGARLIGTRTEAAVADHASLDALAHHAPGCDAAIVAAGFDNAVRAGREMLRIPVLGITEASLHIARLVGSRFGVVALNPRVAAVLRELIMLYGFGDGLCGMRALPAGVVELFRDPDLLANAIADAAGSLVEECGAEVVVMLGAVMAGVTTRVQAWVAVPMLDGISCAVSLAESMVRLQIPKARTGSFAPLPASEQIGLGPALASQFG